MMVFGMANSSAGRAIEACRLRITIRSVVSMFLSVVMVDERPIRGASSKPRSEFMNSATHLTTVRYNVAEFLQTSSSSLLISVVFSPFRVKNFMIARCSIFDIFEK